MKLVRVFRLAIVAFSLIAALGFLDPAQAENAIEILNLLIQFLEILATII